MNRRLFRTSIGIGFLLAASAALFAQGKSDAGMRPTEPQAAVHFSRGAAPPAAVGGVKLLNWNGGPVMHGATSVIPIFWGPKWNDATWTGDKVTGLTTFYAGVGSTAYLGTNVEYSDASGNVSSAVSVGAAQIDFATATPKAAPSTSAVLAEVCHVATQGGATAIANGYYPVYTDIRRGNAGYCAWHSAASCGGAPVTFAFFFDLAGDSGCSVTGGATGGSAHSEGLASLANVSGHELSEMLTDPRLNAWYDRQGYENSDKCAWTFGSSALKFSDNSTWKVQGNWSNAAYNANIGYSSGSTKYRGCIDGDNAKLP